MGLKPPTRERRVATDGQVVVEVDQLVEVGVAVEALLGQVDLDAVHVAVADATYLILSSVMRERWFPTP